jgi:transposase-like protein
MTRGAPHPAQLRAEAVAAVLAGQALADVARRYGIAKGTLGNWLAERDVGTIGTPDAHNEPDLGELIYGLIQDHIQALSAQLQAASRPEWLRQQSAADLAQLLGAERDTLLRLLAGLRPAPEPDQPRLDAPGASAAEP